MFEVNKFDSDLVSGIIFKLDQQSTSTPINGPITVPNKPAGVIPFQFPPRVTGDSKNSNWTTMFDTFQWEPTKMWKGSSARSISISTTYVVTGATINDVEWTSKNIALTTRAFKQYFYSTSKVGVFPAIELVLYDHVPRGFGPNGNSKFRLMSVNIKPGSDIIRDKDGSIFSLRTEVDFTIEQITQIKSKDGGKKLTWTNLPPSPTQDWY